MKIKYVGRLSGVDIDGVGVVMRGAEVEVSRELAEDLLRRSAEWEKVGKASKQEAAK